MAMNENSLADLPILQTSEALASIVLDPDQEETNDQIQTPFEFDRLPTEVAVEIMSRMPVETLKQLKLVNKSKNSLITGLLNNSEFVAKHLHIQCHSRANASASFLHGCLVVGHGADYETIVPLLTLLGRQGDICCNREEHRLRSFFVEEMEMPFELKLGHCDGIVFFNESCSFVTLCNPALREFSTFYLPSELNKLASFMYSVEEIGFGYDRIAEEYKVVRIVSTFDWDKHYRIAEVFTLGTQSWREIEISVPDWGRARLGSPVYFQGVCFWLMNDKKVLSFEMSSEVFRSVDLPDYRDREIILEPLLRLAMRSGSVCLLCYDRRVREAANFVRMWVMEIERSDYGWRELPSIELVPRILMSPLTFSKEDELVVSTEDDNMGCYNVVSGELRTIPIFRGECSTLCLNPYVPSLVSVKRLIKKS